MLCRTRGIDTISQYDFYESTLLLRFVIKKFIKFVVNDAKVCEFTFFMVRNGNFEGHYAVQ